MKSKLYKRFSPVLIVSVLLLSFIFAVGFIRAPRAQAAAGTPEYGWYGDGNADEFTINTANELAGLANIVNGTAGGSQNNFSGKTITLTADIDLSDYGEDFNDGKGWMPIGNSIYKFSGTFDGGGYIIEKLFIDDGALNFAGLFGCISQGTVKNTGIVNADITAGNYIGILVGEFYGSFDTKIESCYVGGTVSGIESVGGLAGILSYSATAINYYSSAAVSGTGNYVGGITGHCHDGAKISYCYSTGTVSGNNAVGGVVGSNVQYADSLTNCAALNPWVKSNLVEVGRVAGFFTGTLSNNYAFDDMTDGGGTIFPDGQNTLSGRSGADLRFSQASTAAFWTTSANWNTVGWNTDIWKIEEGNLPILKNIGGNQSGEWPHDLPKYEIAFRIVGDNGTLTATVDETAVLSGVLVQYNKNIIFTASPNTGYCVKEWKVNGVAVGNTSNNFTLTCVDEAEVSVEFELIINANTPIITAQPQGTTADQGGSVTLSVTASISDGGTLTYQWYKNTANSNTGGTAIEGAVDTVYMPDTSVAGITYYYVVITNTNNGVNGTKNITTTSNTVAVTVEKAGLSTGAIIAIIISSVAVIAGGFTGYWFISRKKKAGKK